MPMNKNDLRIIFFGTPEFAVESLDAIIKAGYNVVAAVTMPDKPAGRGHKMYHSPVKEYAVTHSIPLLQPVRLKDADFIEELRSFRADLFIVIAFRMLPEAVWQMPPSGTFNLHASLLPRYRGAAPINWAVINGDIETGVTTFFLKHEIDTGDVIAQERIAISPEDNVGDVHDRLMHLGARLTVKTIDSIAAGNLKTIPQNNLLTAGETPTPAPKIFKETCHIDWTKNAEDVHNLVRGLSPYPCAWAELFDCDNPDSAPLSTLKIQKTAIIEACNLPGTVTDTVVAGKALINVGRLFVMCGDGSYLEILRLQPSGKRPMDTADFLRGARFPDRIRMA